MHGNYTGHLFVISSLKVSSRRRGSVVYLDHNDPAPYTVWHSRAGASKIFDGCINEQMAPTHFSSMFFLNSSSENEIPLPSMELGTVHMQGAFTCLCVFEKNK